MLESQSHEKWPNFSRVKYRVGAGVDAGIAWYLSEVGVPRSLVGHEYRSLSPGRLVQPVEGGQLVEIGTLVSPGKMFVENPGGRVVCATGPDVSDRSVVNSNLEAFSRCVEFVISKFPFYDTDSIERAEEVADSLEESLLSIDPLVAAHHGFWEAFLSDVSVGDYTTEEILGGEE